MEMHPERLALNVVIPNVCKFNYLKCCSLHCIFNKINILALGDVVCEISSLHFALPKINNKIK